MHTVQTGKKIHLKESTLVTNLLCNILIEQPLKFSVFKLRQFTLINGGVIYAQKKIKHTKTPFISLNTTPL